jgi:hypothetical protein
VHRILLLAQAAFESKQLPDRDIGAQEILYFTGGALTYIGYDINTTLPNWLLTANTLAVTSIVPCVGHLTDLLGMLNTSITTTTHQPLTW